MNKKCKNLFINLETFPCQKKQEDLIFFINMDSEAENLNN